MPEYPRNYGADELTSLVEWLQYERECVINKLEGLTEEQVRFQPAPTANSLLGLVNHLTYVEHWWFYECFLGKEPLLPDIFTEDRDADFKPPADQTIGFTVKRYRDECARSDEIARAALSIDDLAKHPKYSGLKLRWILEHMVEETARHAGHADIARELIDGSIGM